MVELDRVAFGFFKLFAQYEYALKALGYGRAKQSGAAEADWDRFANEVGSALLSSRELNVIEARNYLFENPPKRQIWVAGAVQWDPVRDEHKGAQSLFGHIRRARNNLYHGGKFNGRWIEPERSSELLSNSMTLLESLLDVEPKLREAVRGNAG